MAVRPSRACLPSGAVSLLVVLALAAPGGARAQTVSAALRVARPMKGVPFGGSTAGHDGRIVVGGRLGTTGDVYVYDGTSGALLLTIGDPNPEPDDWFGAAVAWVGDDVLVGAPRSDVVGTDRGAAYLFDGTDGSLLHTFTRPDAMVGWFGCSVAGLGDDAVVGYLGPLDPTGAGAFLFDGATGALLQSLKDPNAGTTSAGAFGRTVVTDATSVFVASPYGASAVYRFAPDGSLLQTYADPEPVDADQFGFSLALVNGHLAVGVGLDGGGQRIYLYDVATGALQHTYVEPAVPYFGLYLGAVVNAVATSAGESVRLYDVDPPYAFRQELREPTPYTDDRDGFGQAIGQFDDGLLVGAAAGVTAFDPCGNGVRTAREQCDDGNLVDGDGCSSRCTLETCGSAPAAGCVTATTSQIALRDENSLYQIRDALKWSWVGPATDLATLGDPLTTTDLSLCVYDRTEGPVPRLRMQSATLAGGTCGTHPCWSSTGGDLRYVDKALTPSGIAKLILKTGAGATKLLVLGRGPDLGVPAAIGGTLPLVGQVTVQLRSSTSPTCLEADFPLPAKNTKGSYRDKTN